MPTIKKMEHKPSTKRTFQSERSERAHKLYNTQRWRKLREAQLMRQPLCEMCLKEGRTTPAQEVHHCVPILSTDDSLMQQFYAYDPNNLMSLCKDCHHKIHQQMRNS